jgi:hypothetical protein
VGTSTVARCFVPGSQGSVAPSSADCRAHNIDTSGVEATAPLDPGAVFSLPANPVPLEQTPSKPRGPRSSRGGHAGFAKALELPPARYAGRSRAFRRHAKGSTEADLAAAYARDKVGFSFSKFWRNVDRSAGPDGCWLWQGGVSGGGYGMFNDRLCGSSRAHKIALVISLKRDLFPGMEALHSCDVRSCCNPAHLSEGTHRENMREMVERGRSTKGQSLPQRANTRKHPANDNASPSPAKEPAL